MSIPYTPLSVVGGTYTALQIKDELDKIQTAFAEALSRTGGTPNQMEEVLDMNSHRIINLLDAVDAQDAVTLAQVSTLVSEIEGTGITSAAFDALAQSLGYKKIAYLESVYAKLADIPEEYVHPDYKKVQRTYLPGYPTGSGEFEYHISTENLLYGNTFIFVSTPYAADHSYDVINFNIGNVAESQRDITIIVSSITPSLGGGEGGGTASTVQVATGNNSYVGNGTAALTDPNWTTVYTYRTVNSGDTWFVVDTQDLTHGWEDITDFDNLFATVEDGDRLGGHLTNEIIQSEPLASASQWQGTESGLNPYGGFPPWGKVLKNSSGYMLPSGLATLTRTGPLGSEFSYPEHTAGGDWYFSAYVWLGNSPLTDLTIAYEDNFRIQYKDTAALTYTDVPVANIGFTQVFETSSPDVYRINCRVTGITLANGIDAEVGIRQGLYAEVAGEETVWNGFGFSYEDTGRWYIGTDGPT